MTIQLLPCAHPPAVRLTGRSGLTTYFNHTFDDSGVRSVGGRIYIVTLTHPTTNQVGFAVSCMYRVHISMVLFLDDVVLNATCPNLQLSNTSDTIIPYTIIPVDTTGCKPAGRQVICPS